ncbi:MAG: hypothetical protein GY845_03345 [Planctomycetes bacterium]|nr:hypothetical protein [Planctomycetota bacterium]
MSKTMQIFNSLSNKRTGRDLAKLFGSNAPEFTQKLFDSDDANAMGSAAGAGLSPAIWDTCPRGLMMVDPTSGHFIGDDFTFTNATSYTTANDYILAGTNGTFAATAADPNGVALITAPGTDNDEANVNHAMDPGCIKLDATKDWWFEARVKINQIATAQGVFVGLIEDSITMGTDFMTDNTMALKVQDLIGFQVLSATNIAAIWQTMMIFTGRAAVNATAATASTGFVKLGMKGVQGAVSFYVDGVADSETVDETTTNFPVDKYVVPAFATKCGSATANTLSVDWWYAAQTR